MAVKKSFIMYTDHYRLINKLTDEECGMLLKAVYEYQVNGKITELPPAADMLFGVICNQLDRDNEKWARTVERRAEAGRAGGKAKAENAQASLANASKRKQMLANLADSDNDNDNDNVSVSDSESESDSESAGEPSAEEAPPAPPPTPPPDTPDNTIRRPRGKHGNVMLTDAEYERIQLVRPNDWEAKIDHMDWYLDTNPGKVYPSHFETIMKWAEQDDATRPQPKASDTSVHFTIEQLFKGKHGDIFADPFSSDIDDYFERTAPRDRKEDEE